MIQDNLYEKIENKDGSITYKKYDIWKTKICDKDLETVVRILQGLDLEKEKEMLLTMDNLSKWANIIQEEWNEQLQRAIQDMIKRNEQLKGEDK